MNKIVIGIMFIFACLGIAAFIIMIQNQKCSSQGRATREAMIATSSSNITEDVFRNQYIIY